MFGLMKRAERLAYCGSCKTIGAMYGQRARLLLNHDMVFLGELLVGEPAWGPAHRSFNCMSMPKEHPAGLKYAATAAVVLAHFQIEDQLADSGRTRWKALKRFFSPAYRKAAADFRASGFPLEELTALLGSQTARERRAASFEDVAEPTARATEMVFAHGAPELASIGRRFGYLVYVLDAWEDRVRDTKTRDFNALLAFPEVDGRAEILATVASLEKDLPVHLAARLRANVEERLGIRMRVLHGACRKSARARWKSAVEFARDSAAAGSAGEEIRLREFLRELLLRFVRLRGLLRVRELLRLLGWRVMWRTPLGVPRRDSSRRLFPGDESPAATRVSTRFHA